MLGLQKNKMYITNNTQEKLDYKNVWKQVYSIIKIFVKF